MSVSIVLIILLLWGALWFRMALAVIKNQPDFRVGDRGNPYLRRWWILPRNRFLNIYLHQILRDDDDRALHDHPWASLSFPLAGRLSELRHGANWSVERRDVSRLWPIYRPAKLAHRLVVVNGPVWTLFVTGPVVRNWGFWCVSETTPGSRSARFVRWQDFVGEDIGTVGRGCGEG